MRIEREARLWSLRKIWEPQDQNMVRPSWDFCNQIAAYAPALKVGHDRIEGEQKQRGRVSLMLTCCESVNFSLFGKEN